jgi:hypothetical protein
MRLTKLSPGSRTTLVLLAAVLVLGMLAMPSFAAHRNVHITGQGFFEPFPSECATGDYQAEGVWFGHGDFRICGRQFRSPSIVQGTLQLHNSDDLSPSFKVQCKPTDGDRARHFDCKGQWSVNGPNWQGGGNLRIILDFTTGALDFTAVGNLTAV